MPKSKESPYFCQTFAQHRSIVCTRVLKVLLMKHSFSSVFRSIVSTRLPRNFLRAPFFQGAHIFVTRPQEWQFQSRIKLGDRVALAEMQQGTKRKHSLHVFLYCFVVFFPPLRLSTLSPRQRIHFSSFLQLTFKSLGELILQMFMFILDLSSSFLYPFKHLNL